MGKMARSTVKWFNDSKGLGFINAVEGSNGQDIFVHYTAILGDEFKTLAEGETVEFELIPGPKGFQAAAVEKMGAVS